SPPGSIPQPKFSSSQLQSPDSPPASEEAHLQKRTSLLAQRAPFVAKETNSLLLPARLTLPIFFRQERSVLHRYRYIVGHSYSEALSPRDIELKLEHHGAVIRAERGVPDHLQ